MTKEEVVERLGVRLRASSKEVWDYVQQRCARGEDFMTTRPGPEEIAEWVAVEDSRQAHFIIGVHLVLYVDLWELYREAL